VQNGLPLTSAYDAAAANAFARRVLRTIGVA
jgi:hypothetical protein